MRAWPGGLIKEPGTLRYLRKVEYGLTLKHKIWENKLARDMNTQSTLSVKKKKVFYQVKLSKTVTFLTNKLVFFSIEAFLDSQILEGKLVAAP